MNGIVYRLGWVLYWGACITAVLTALLGLISFLETLQILGISDNFLGIGCSKDLALRAPHLCRPDKWGPFYWMFSLPIAVVTWLIGRATRYVLAGD